MLLMMVCVSASYSQVSFYPNVQRLFHQKCGVCHVKGGVAPFEIQSEEDVYNHLKIIKEVIETGYMPPWYVNEDSVHYSNSLRLSEEERKLLGEWYDGGCVLGDPESMVLNHELVENKDSAEYPFHDYSVFKSFVVPASDNDKYLRVSIVPTALDTLSESLELIGIKFNPGNKNVVHHAELYAVEQDQLNDSLFMASDYFFLEDHGGVMPGAGYRFISSWLPGQDIDYFPEGTIKTIDSNESLVLLVHYGAFPTDQTDSTTVRFYTRPNNTAYETILTAHEFTVIDENAWNPARVFIKADQRDTIEVKRKIDHDGDLAIFGLHPHAHLLCTSMHAVLVSPKGDSTLLIDLPHWDFDWQHFYRFEKYIKAEYGSEITFTATYDNTDRNPENPNYPPVDVYSSFRANDEMMVLFILAKEYKEGDELLEIPYPQIPLDYY